MTDYQERFDVTLDGQFIDILCDLLSHLKLYKNVLIREKKDVIQENNDMMSESRIDDLIRYYINYVRSNIAKLPNVVRVWLFWASGKTDETFEGCCENVITAIANKHIWCVLSFAITGPTHDGIDARTPEVFAILTGVKWEFTDSAYYKETPLHSDHDNEEYGAAAFYNALEENDFFSIVELANNESDLLDDCVYLDALIKKDINILPTLLFLLTRQTGVKRCDHM